MSNKPIDMILYCPSCKEQHIDAPEGRSVERYPATALLGEGKFRTRLAWTNPPHRSHLCHHCATVWRPADVPTNGVGRIATRGENDTWQP